MSVDSEYRVRGEADYLVLALETSSQRSEGVIQRVSDILWSDRTPRQTRGFTAALGALIGGLLRSEGRNPKGWSYRKASSGSFTGEPIGYRGYKQAFDRLTSAGYLQSQRGTGGGTEIGIATRFRPTPSFFSLLEGAGISVSNWREHFRSLPRPATIKHPIILKRSSVWTWGKKRPGKAMSVDLGRSPAREMGAQVNEINAFLAGVDIQPDDLHHGLHRLFNQADLPEFAWNKGGRLYSIGGGYQSLSRSERSQITLDGQPVVEFDIRASHLTILHAALGKPFDPAGDDPYSIDGIPRDIVKAWVTMTLGYDQFQTRWSKPNKAKFAAAYGKLQEAYPIKTVRDKVLERLPILADWPSCPIRWGDLQFLESCAVFDTVHSLAIQDGIPALPVHDSIIVPQSEKETAMQRFADCFRTNIGCDPVLTTD